MATQIQAMSPPRRRGDGVVAQNNLGGNGFAAYRRLATSSQAPARLRRLPSASVSSFLRRWFNLLRSQNYQIGKLIARKQWVVAGSDDMFMCVYNYNTMDKVKVFEAPTGYIRDGCALKYLRCHSYYVMQVNFNRKDTNTFAGASLDHSIKIWNLGSPDPNFSLDAHLKGVNCVDYFVSGDKPYLISGSDDHTAKNRFGIIRQSCIQTLEGHTHNVSAVCFHSELPIIITGSEDGTVRIWHGTTYRQTAG
ncbi:Coatomer subunit beta'-2 [Sesamum angolense]|uniref:Coatomer subunit beta'-2 n=1 Tax=Sesamum angolense TaxID=2727404 RepID=A0AAE1WD42_9LAMI|nr:Coatomer subunit beta'-2 [Sesamum angolense]